MSPQYPRRPATPAGAERASLSGSEAFSISSGRFSLFLLELKLICRMMKGL
jgi:hypothetical protein